MKRQFPSLIIVLLTFLHLPLLTMAQEKDPLEMARDYPPNLIKVDVALEQMQWRLRQLRETLHEQEKMYREINITISQHNDQIDSLTQKLPIELRFASDDVRSKLIGDVLRELLSGRLDVASKEETISQFALALEKSEKDLTKVDELRKQKYQLNIKASQQKLNLAEREYAGADNLAKKGAKSQSELERAKFTLELAKMELEHAVLDYELEKSSRVNEIANRLVEARISLQPANWRVAAAEQFLKLFSDSHDKFESIAESSRKIARFDENRQQIERRIGDTKDQISELELLRKMTISAAEAFEKKEKLNEKE